MLHAASEWGSGPSAATRAHRHDDTVGLALDDDRIVTSGGEELRAIGLDHDDVLDADVRPARQHDARFHGVAHVGLEDALPALDEPGRLVHVLADAVAQPMGEVLAVAASGDQAPGGAVSVLAGGLARLHDRH